MNAKPKRGWGVWLGYCVAAWLLLGGASRSAKLVGYLFDVARMQSWPKIEAIVEKAELNKTDNEDFSTFTAVASYRYRYLDSEHVGTRVDVADRGDWLGNYQKRTAQWLIAESEAGRPVACYVNPENPDESVLLRDVRPTILAWRSAIALLLAGSGAGLAFGLWRWQRRKQRRVTLQELHPNEPWLWNDAWRPERLRHSNKPLLLSIGIAALIWNLVALPLCLGVRREQGAAGSLGVVGTVFAVIGAGLVLSVLAHVRFWFRFGVSELRLATLPGVIGGPMAGVILSKMRRPPEGGHKVTLSCVERVTRTSKSGSKTETSTSDVVLWQDELNVVETLTDSGTGRLGIPFKFAIPHGCQPCDDSNPKKKISWRLKVEAGTYSARFDVPVFVTPESSPTYRGDSEFLQRFTDDLLTPEQALTEAGFRVSQLPGGGTRVEGAQRLTGGILACGTAMWAFCWAGFGFVVWMAWPWPVLLFAGGVAVMITVAVLEAVFWRSRMDIEGENLTASAGFPLLRRAVTMPRAKATVKISSEFTTEEKHWLQLVLHGPQAQPITLARRLATKRLAQAAKAALKPLVRGTPSAIEKADTESSE